MQRVVSLLTFVAALVACSGDDGGDAVGGSIDADGSAPSSVVGIEAVETTASTPAAGAASGSASSTESYPVAAETSSTTTIVDVPETGVPGLDSDDEFCSAWSRFGGTWQVLLVGSTFLDDADRIAEWEIVAASTIDAAFRRLMEELPAELDGERERLESGYFGVLHRRSVDALTSLREVGRDDAAERLEPVWLDALASRDPSTPDLAVEVPDDLRDVVERAAAEFASKRVEFRTDPSLVVAVDTPLTDEYLETSCPDQGTLTGGEVDAS